MMLSLHLIRPKTLDSPDGHRDVSEGVPPTYPPRAGVRDKGTFSLGESREGRALFGEGLGVPPRYPTRAGGWGNQPRGGALNSGQTGLFGIVLTGHEQEGTGNLGSLTGASPTSRGHPDGHRDEGGWVGKRHPTLMMSTKPGSFQLEHSYHFIGRSRLAKEFRGRQEICRPGGI